MTAAGPRGNGRGADRRSKSAAPGGAAMPSPQAPPRAAPGGALGQRAAPGGAAGPQTIPAGAASGSAGNGRGTGVGFLPHERPRQATMSLDI